MTASNVLACSGRRNIKRLSGFTLVELMIVIAIVAILASLAVPAYLEHIKKGKRGEAMVALLEGAQALERYYSSNGRYVTVSGGSTLAPVFPTQVPAAGAAYYNIAATGTPSANSYTLRATRAGSMAGDDCGNFEINQAGARTLNGNSGKTVDQCWRR